MKRINKKDLDRVKQIDLLTYFSNYYPDELTKSYRGEYRLKNNHSLVLSNGMWNDFGSIKCGGRTALDYLIKVEGIDFLTAAFTILDKINEKVPEITKQNSKKLNTFRLPARNTNNKQVISYLTKKRKIDKDIVQYCIDNGLLYEDKYHNAVFLGYDYNHICRYGFRRSTSTDSKIEVSGSQKEYSFKITNKDSKNIHVFEAAIDLLSFMTLEKMKHHELNDNYIALGGTSPLALNKYLNNNVTNTIILHLDNDEAGRVGSKNIEDIYSKKYNLINEPSKHEKDYNALLIYKIRIENHER